MLRILDTNFLADYLHGQKDAVKALDKFTEQGSIATTMLSIFELYTGAYRSHDPAKKINEIIQLMESIDVITLNQNSAKQAGIIMSKLLQRKQIFRQDDVAVDVLIAGIARSIGAVIITKDKDFVKMGAKIESW
jgi:predicted nucleic acid-binding protein